MIILLDVDNVLVDCSAAVHKKAELIIGRPLPPPAEWEHFDFAPAMRLNKNETELFHRKVGKATPGGKIGYKIKFYPGAQSFIEHLGDRAKVVFVTAPWRGIEHWVEARYALLEPYLGRKNYSIVFTHDKEHVRGDWLIDDKVENIQANEDRGILFSQPWNKHYDASRRAENYTEVIEQIFYPPELVKKFREQMSPEISGYPGIHIMMGESES